MEDLFARWSRDLQSSDRNAFAALFQSMHPALLRYAWRLTGDEEAAQDVVQEAFMKLWQTRADIDPARSLKALLYTIVRNLSLNYNRMVQGRPVVTNAEASLHEDRDPSVEEALDATQLGQLLRKWIAEMPDRRREAFMLSRFSGLSHEEIAQIMNLTPRTVNTHIVLALKHLRAQMRTLELDGTAL